MALPHICAVANLTLVKLLTFVKVVIHLVGQSLIIESTWKRAAPFSNCTYNYPKVKSSDQSKKRAFTKAAAIYIKVEWSERWILIAEALSTMKMLWLLCFCLC